jgi:Alpha amylase, catalytic domain
MRHHEDILMLDNDPLWYQDAIIYELHVRTFHDSDGDGIGDFRGLTQKLDYLQDLGVTALWLLPFCPSPLRDDGYDIADYSNIHPHYGTLRDFRDFLREGAPFNIVRDRSRRELRVDSGVRGTQHASRRGTPWGVKPVDNGPTSASHTVADRATPVTYADVKEPAQASLKKTGESG